MNLVLLYKMLWGVTRFQATFKTLIIYTGNQPRKTGRLTSRKKHTIISIDRQTDDRQTDRQTNRQTDR